MTKRGIPKPDLPIIRSSMQQAGANEKGLTVVSAPPAHETPAAAPAGETSAAPPITPAASQPKARQKSAPAHDTAYKRLSNSRDVLLSLPEDLKDRMVNTIAWTNMHTGITHQQKFIRLAIEQLCEQLESNHNQGRPFPAAARPGRP